ncbi:CapA family protein [Paenibacillus psychroresistens]|uniref:CapA family protein n=2 Tax=Paenibacillus psychroresistens TaxID=1778678 RepID=A0A6B8RUI1_9BACL|nr:CapA family protein [Paenibacillus psychroresistens]
MAPSVSPTDAVQATVIPSSEPSPSPTSSPNAVTAEDPNLIHMAFVGDILLASGVETLMKQNGFDYPYKDVKELLLKPDLTIGNLETPVTDRGELQLKEYNYRSSPLALPALKEAGLDLVNLANNHIMDYGSEGMLDTMDHLDNVGIKRVGAGHDAKEAFESVIIEKNGMKIAFLGFSRVVPEASWKAGVKHPGVADTYDYRAPVLAIEKARAEADLVVVITHWGVERTDTPVAYQTELAHLFIDAGADLVVGGHPHVLQGVEAYKGKWIAYSLGNFIFTTNSVKETLETFVLNATCSKERQCTLNVVPIKTVYAKPAIMDVETGQALFERISAVSYHAEIQPDGQIIEKP